MKAFRLVTGEEIIGNVTGDDFELHFDKPAAVIIQPSQTGSAGVALVPLMIYADGPVTIKTQHIMCECSIDEKLAVEYKRMYHSGELVIPTTKLVTS